LLAEPTATWPAWIAAYLGRTLNHLFGYPSDRAVAAGVCLQDLGVDSLLAIQLQARVASDLRVELPIRTLFGETVASLGLTLAAQIRRDD
jgi:hypothetical protein